MATVTELALRREAIISTAVEHGWHFSRARCEGGGLTFAVGLKEKGLPFGVTMKKVIRFSLYRDPDARHQRFTCACLPGWCARSIVVARKALLIAISPRRCGRR
jgi:hypothetical protein